MGGQTLKSQKWTGDGRGGGVGGVAAEGGYGGREGGGEEGGGGAERGGEGGSGGFYVPYARYYFLLPWIRHYYSGLTASFLKLARQFYICSIRLPCSFFFFFLPLKEGRGGGRGNLSLKSRFSSCCYGPRGGRGVKSVIQN